MNGRERILSALKGLPVDKTPVGSILTVVTEQMMAESGVCWPDAHLDAEKMARLASMAHVMCGFDSIKLPFDMTVEHEALGGEVDFGGLLTLPQAKHLWDFGYIPQFPGDLLVRGRVPLVLEAIGIAKENHGKDAAIVTSIVGPLALATKLYGTEDVLVASITDPDLLEKTLDFTTDIAIEYALAQQRAGSDVILIGDPVSSGDLISPECYSRHILRHHRRLIEALEIPCVLHICGSINGHMSAIAQTGAAGISFDYKTDPVAARLALGGKTAMIGWVDPLDILLRGTPEAVYEASVQCIKQGAAILSPGCALAPTTPIVNLHAMKRATEDVLGALPHM